MTLFFYSLFVNNDKWRSQPASSTYSAPSNSHSSQSSSSRDLFFYNWTPLLFGNHKIIHKHLKIGLPVLEMIVICPCVWCCFPKWLRIWADISAVVFLACALYCQSVTAGHCVSRLCHRISKSKRYNQVNYFVNLFMAYLSSILDK